MTISTTNSRVEYTGAGTTGPFSFPHYFLEDDDLVVIKRTIATGAQQTLTLTTDYTVSGAGVPAGGSVTTVAAVSSAYEIIIFRDPDILQGTEYPEGDRFPSASHEKALDKLTMVAQRLKDMISRSLRLTDGDTTGGAMELPIDRASKYMAFDADGNPVATAGTSSDVVVSAFVETLLDDADASAALTTLGISAFIKTLLDDADTNAALTTLGAKLATQLAPGALGNVMRSDGAGAWEAGAAAGSLSLVFNYPMNPYAINTVISSGYTSASRHAVQSIEFECISAELNYSVGDFVTYTGPAVSVSAKLSSGTSYSCWIVTNATLPQLNDKSTGGLTSITAAKWKMHVKLYKLN